MRGGARKGPNAIQADPIDMKRMLSLISEGYTKESVARQMGITRSVLYKTLKQYSTEQGKELRDYVPQKPRWSPRPLPEIILSRGNPLPCREIMNPNKVRRRVFCKNYGDCLDFAVSKEWQNFHCLECTDYTSEEQELDHIADESSCRVFLARMR